METAAHTEPVLRRIKYKAREPFLISVEVDYQTATRVFGEDTFGAATFKGKKTGHFFTPKSRGSDGTSGLVSFEIRNVHKLRLSGPPEPQYFDPMFDRRVEPDAQDIVFAGQLLAIYDRALGVKSRRG